MGDVVDLLLHRIACITAVYSKDRRVYFEIEKRPAGAVPLEWLKTLSCSLHDQHHDFSATGRIEGVACDVREKRCGVPLESETHVVVYTNMLVELKKFARTELSVVLMPPVGASRTFVAKLWVPLAKP
jgi:hypothetical protein